MRPQMQKLKAVFVTLDGGETWMLERQHYLVDLKTNDFLNESLQGEIFRIIRQENEDHDGKEQISK